MTGDDTAVIVPRYGTGGYFAIYVTAPNGPTVDVTFFRGVPTLLTQMGWADPFGAVTLQVEFPAITMLERTGTGDMKWLVPEADIDVLYFDLNEGTWANWAWEGYLISEDFSDSGGRRFTAKGALFQLDNFLAAPQFPQQPIPYELLIKEAFDPHSNPSLRTRQLKTVFPSDWPDKVPTADKKTPWYMKPWGVTAGESWTGLTSRSTGSWEPKLTGFVQTLLTVMYTPDGGQWTIRQEKGRQPVLCVRPALRTPTAQTYVVAAGAPGIELSVSRDFSQTVNVVYAAGQDLSGTAFSGQQVSNDGASTYYEPYAASPLVYPATDTNPRLLPHMMRKEKMLTSLQGIDENAVRDVSMTQLRKHSDPGFTGTLTLKSDPKRYGTDKSVTKYLMKAGDSVLVTGLAGTDILFHVTDAQIDFEQGSVALTIDSKFRDALTVAEVKARTRDALDPVRQLQVGKFATLVQDLVKPWSYASGSGIIPSGGTMDATALFTKYMGNDARFPWTEYTTRYAPKDFPEFYIKIPKRRADANKNWATMARDGQTGISIPVRMSQSGTIRLSQIAAYDKNGNVMPVSFHVGIYGGSGVNYQSMPSIPQAWIESKTDPIAKEAREKGYLASQHYPFFKDAFEQMKATGERQDQPNYLIAGGDIQQAIAWGNYYERAGYSPGLMSAVGRNNPTGLLQDESVWQFDTTSATDFDPYSSANTAKNAEAGMMYVLIYCDDHEEDVYFLGRLFRAEPTGK